MIRPNVVDPADRWQRARANTRVRIVLLLTLGAGALVWADDYAERMTTKQIEMEMREDGLRG